MWDIRLGQAGVIIFARVLLNVLGHVEETLQIAQRIVGFALVNLTVETSLACSIHTALVN